MTNEEIIARAAKQLAGQGIIKSIEMNVRSIDGDSTIMVPETIHTYAEWKRKGFQVNRGEHAIAKIRIWKYTTKKKDGEDKEESKMFMTNAAFFSKSQVSAIGG